MVRPVALELGDGLFVLAPAHRCPLDNAGFRRFRSPLRVHRQALALMALK
jgi:hypothetical protein